MKQIILRLLGLLALIGISYGLARLLVSAWEPGEAMRLVLGVALLILVLPLAYWALYRHYRYTHDIPHFLLPPDFILPLSVYPVIILAFIFVTPRFAVWQWGAQGTGTVQALTVEERDDIDYGTTRHYRVDYTFERENGQTSSNTSYVSQTLFDSLQPEDVIALHYVPWWPRLVTAGDPMLFGWQATVLLWGTLIVLLWLLGTSVISRRRYPPPSPPPYPPPQSAVDLLGRYDLDTQITDADDAELWAAVIVKHFPMPEDEEINVAGLRFSLGEFAPDARLKMQPTNATCFTRVDKHHLRRVECAPDEQTDANFDEALIPALPLLLLYVDKVGREKRPLYTIVVPRPSTDAQRLPVYTGVCHGHGNASGQTTYWERLPDGAWQYSGEKLNWWMDGA